MDVGAKAESEVLADKSATTPAVSVAKSSLMNIERTADEFLRVAYSGEASPPAFKRRTAKHGAASKDKAAKAP